ncbi:Ldh family oxidoreductase [Chloroflexota bacterium]
MNSDDSTYYVDWHTLRDFAIEALMKASVLPEDAFIIADTLVETELRGTDTHGIARLAPYIRMISEGNMNPRPNLSIVKETPITALIDADNGVGNLICVKATEIAIEKARNSGVSIVGVKNSTHCGALVYYPMMALKLDMMGFMTVNGPPVIPAYGGTTKLLASNPYAVAIPAGDELPIVIDMALTAVAMGKIRRKAILGEKLPLGWALDRNGKATEDAEEAVNHGFFTWIGDHKGYSLAVLANILCGVLTGSAFGPQTFPPWHMAAEYGSELLRQGHFIMVLAVENFMPIDEFQNRMDAMIRETKTSKLAKGFDRIYLPGERGFECKAQRLKTGIPISQLVWKSLMRVKKALGLSSSLE